MIPGNTKVLVSLTSRLFRVFTREEIIDQLWGTDIFVGDRKSMSISEN